MGVNPVTFLRTPRTDKSFEDTQNKPRDRPSLRVRRPHFRFLVQVINRRADGLRYSSDVGERAPQSPERWAQRKILMQGTPSSSSAPACAFSNSSRPKSATRIRGARLCPRRVVWCVDAGVPSIAAVQPVHVAAWIEAGTRELAAPSIKQRLGAIRHLIDWLVTGRVVPVNPAGSVRGPRHVATSGQTAERPRTPHFSSRPVLGI